MIVYVEHPGIVTLMDIDRLDRLHVELQPTIDTHDTGAQSFLAEFGIVDADGTHAWLDADAFGSPRMRRA
jgi:hypothetical protein